MTLTTEPTITENKTRTGDKSKLPSPNLLTDIKEARSRLMDAAIENVAAFLERKAQNAVG